jgi:hypothetical protein
LAKQIVVTSHEAIAEASTLYNSVTNYGEKAVPKARAFIIDEAIEPTKKLVVKTENIFGAREMVEPAKEHLAREIEDAKAWLAKVEQDEDKDGIAAAKAHAKQLDQAQAWVEAVAPELDRVQKAIAAISRDKMGTRIPFGRDNWPVLTELLSDMPQQAVWNDGTRLESISTARAIGKKGADLPTSWLMSLGRAMVEGTAWIYKGKIVGGHTSSLWTTALDHGALLLDATPKYRHVSDVQAAGGQVFDIIAATPNLKISQIGPNLLGRKLSKREIERRVKIATDALDSAPIGEVCVMAHKKVALKIREARPNHVDQDGGFFSDWWGQGEKAHNRWRACKKLIIIGPPTKNAEEMAIDYAIDQVALAAHGAETWDGSIERRPWIEVAGGHEIRSALPLPTSESARAWLLDDMAASFGQANGRLRAVQRPNEQLEVVIYGAVPIVGHGVKIDDFLIGAGRASNNADMIEAISDAVITSIDAGNNPTRRAIAAAVFEATGRRPSNATIDKVIRSIRRAALMTCSSFEAMAAEVIDAVKILRKAGVKSAALVELSLFSRGFGRAIHIARARLMKAMETEAMAASPLASRAGP